MKRVISILTVILFLPIALVPPGFMPAALADGNGYLMLCPSKGESFPFPKDDITLDDIALNHGVASANSGKSILSVDHQFHHKQSHEEALTSAAHQETHEANNEICDYASLSSGQDLIQTSSWIGSYPQRAVKFKSNARARLVAFSRLSSKQSRAPPFLSILS